MRVVERVCDLLLAERGLLLEGGQLGRRCFRGFLLGGGGRLGLGGLGLDLGLLCGEPGGLLGLGLILGQLLLCRGECQLSRLSKWCRKATGAGCKLPVFGFCAVSTCGSVMVSHRFREALREVFGVVWRNRRGKKPVVPSRRRGYALAVRRNITSFAGHFGGSSAFLQLPQNNERWGESR